MSTSVLPHRPPFVATPAPDRFLDLAKTLREIVPADEVVLLSTMPRGGLQICKKLHVNDALVRRYNLELHPHDRFAWRVLRDGSAAADGSKPDALSESPIAHGLAVTVGVRIESPIFDGYPGLLVLLRRTTQPAPVLNLQKFTTDARAAFDQCFRGERAIIDPTPRQFVFANGKVVTPEDGLARLDSKLAATLTAEVEPRLARGYEGDPSSGRLGLADSSGVHVPVEIVRFEHYPALSQGPVVFASVHPRVQDWHKISPDDFSADPELARLTSAVNFMVTTFRRGPTLEEVAEAVHLSQFHFHRRFSEIFGLTPKHLLYDLQLHEAQRMLADPQQQLVDIAKHCGFAHQSHFTSRFKQGTGLTPTRWRRQVVTFHDA